ncbi:SusC/RagA family TonB-linked outer membrane protein [Sinomicrobium oceani]|uniref:SusC/RagA family TonB-linked outer membrane protein n=1 Tax=Sinomicrobium oceani TaxID=1150368 RepID=UPI00227C6702|nr:SusC/RagA family TonB-linked outer membrane protein [Sinomicrobium oceani]
MKLLTLKQCIQLTFHTFCFLIIGTLLNPVLAADAAGQKLESYKIDLSARNATVVEVLKDIEAQTDFKFVYDRKIERLGKTLDMHYSHESLRAVLEVIARDANLAFRRINNTISIDVNRNRVAKEKVVEIVYLNITGTITDENGVPLAGASVVEKGTSNGTSTDFDGNFSINVAEQAVLIVSYLGYKPQEIVVSGRTEIHIQMLPDAAQLDDVVVVGYGTQKKTDVTGSIASVKEGDFNKGIVTNPGQLLQGKVAGVNVATVSGEPGASQDVIIRGIGSLRSGTTPLYVVDGFALDNTSTGVATNPLNFINPHDIEKIDVLKDASAAAIYGARAANGVIVITTKKGKQGRTEMNLSVSTALSTLARKIDVFGADEFRRQVTAVGGNLRDGGASTDWQDTFTRTAVSKNINFSMGGGTEKFSYFGSAGVNDQEGILRNSNLRTYSGRVNLSQKAFDDRFKVEMNLSGTRTENQRPLTTTIISDMLRSNPTYPAYTDGEPTPVINGDQFNALVREKLYDDFANNNRILANISPSLEIVKGLTYKLNLGVDYSNTEREQQNKPYTAREDEIGTLDISYTSNTNTLVENYLTYKLTHEQHDMTFLAGHTYQETLYRARGWYYRNFPDNGIEPRYQIEAAGNPVSQWSDAIKNELQSFFGRVNYSYADTYLLTLTMRADGSSKFGKNNKYGYFPSVAAGWNISKENFMIDSPVSNLKLRASWGRTGNQEIPSKITQASYTDSRADNDTYPLSDNITSLDDYPYGTVYTRLANPDIQWEVSTQTNIGLDFGLFNNRLTGTVDYFNKISENVLLEVVPSDPIQPTNTFWTNIPDMEIRNKGLEVALEYRSNGNTPDFSYTIGGNAAFTRNKVANSPYQVLTTGAAQGAGQTGATINGYLNGQPIGTFYMKEFLGIDGEGFSEFRDVNGDGEILDNDRMVVGKALPDVTYAFYLNFFYKKFDLNLNFNGAAGNQIYNHTAMSNFTKGNLALSFNTTDKAIAYENEGINNTNEVSTRYLENGDYLRLNNATLGYNLDPQVLGLGDHVRNIRLSLTGQNLFVLTNYSGFDPEVNTGNSSGGIQTFGIDRYTYPKARTFLLGLNVSF